MIKLRLRTALTAVLLGTTPVLSAMVFTAPAQAATVSAHVGAALKAAQTLAAAGNYRAAMAKIAEAEAAPGKTSDDTAVINQMKQYVGVKSGDAAIGGVAGAKAKFANDYNAGRFRDVIASADTLRKHNALDNNAMQIIAQAYFRAGDYAGCARYIRANFPSPNDGILELQARCAYENGDEAAQRQALETLVGRSGKAEHWKNLLRLTERSRGLSDRNALDINRLRLMSGNVTTRDDYTLLAQLALQLGNAAEAQRVIEKGQAAKVLSGERSNRLLDLARTQAAAQAASLPREIAAARAHPQGDALVRIGETMVGQGKAKEAIAVIQQGLKKPLKNPAQGQTGLGYAYLAAGQKADALKAFNSVKAPEKDAMIARRWALGSRFKPGV